MTHIKKFLIAFWVVVFLVLGIKALARTLSPAEHSVTAFLYDVAH